MGTIRAAEACNALFSFSRSFRRSRGALTPLRSDRAYIPFSVYSLFLLALMSLKTENCSNNNMTADRYNVRCETRPVNLNSITSIVTNAKINKNDKINEITRIIILPSLNFKIKGGDFGILILKTSISPSLHNKWVIIVNILSTYC